MPVIFSQQHRRAWQNQGASDSSQSGDTATVNLLAAWWPAGHKLEFTGQLVGHGDLSRYSCNWLHPAGKAEGSL